MANRPRAGCNGYGLGAMLSRTKGIGPPQPLTEQPEQLNPLNHLRHQTPNHSVLAMKFESLSAWRRFSVEEPQSPANFIRNESEPKFDPRIAASKMLLENFSPMIGAVPPNWFGGHYGG